MKKKEFIQLLKITFLSYPRISILLGALIIISSLLELPLPLLTIYFIDHVLKSGNINLLNIVGFSLIIFLIIKSSIDFIRTYLNSKLYESILMKLAIESFKNYIDTTYEISISKSAGYWLSRIQSEPQSLASMFRTIIDLFTTIVSFLMGIIFIFYFNATLGLLVLFLLPIYTYSLFVMAPKLKKGSLLIKEERSKISGFLEENINGLETIKVLALENFKLDEIKNKWNELVKVNLKMAILISINSLLSSLIISFAPIGVLWYGGYLVIINKITLGQVIGINKFLSYVFRPISSIMSINSQVQDAIASLERLNEISFFKKDKKGTSSCIFNENDPIFLKNVSFSFNEKKIFENFNLTIKGGITTAIIGMSGCGKSTLLRIIIGLLKITEGKVFIGAHNITAVDLPALRKQISLIPQNVFLFSNNIKYNLELDLFDKEIDRKIFEVSGINSFYFEKHFTDEYELGNKGLKLSGGQRQRISLARSLLRNPKILLMDEFTSEIDLLTEKKIIEGLIEIRKGKTTVIVAHSFSSVIKADEIIVLSENEIVERGTHEELLKNRNVYSEFWYTHIGQE
ncbi:hypothetical protein C0389_06735 [bacterium]|nr:hypothetical protein [bacterium]